MSEEIRKKSLRRADVDMTEGNITGLLIRFAIPLLAGNLFQMLYNTVDTWVVGNYVSDAAFSAVGNVGPALNMMIAFAIGLGGGSGVVVSQYYGAKQYDRVSDATHTAIVASMLLGLLLSVVGISALPMILKLMKIPADIIAEARTYLLILFATIFCPVVYNFIAGILRAVGDSQHPFYYMVISCISNIVMDLVFVIKFHWGVAGVAYATAIAQVISCILGARQLLKTDSCIRLEPKKLRIDRGLLKKIINVGIPAGIQQSITSFSNLFVQSYINSFGSTVMGGWTAYNKLDQLIQLPVQSIFTGTSTLVGQNLGKGKVDRAKKSVRVSILINVGFSIGAGLLLIIFAAPLTGFFNSNPDIISWGVYFIRHITPVYFTLAVYQTLASALRGAGNAKVPMIAMLSAGVGFRQLYLFTMSRLFPGDILPITYGYPVGWILAGIILIIYYRKNDLGKKRLIDD